MNRSPLENTIGSILLIGRGQQLESVNRALHLAKKGRGRVMIFSGEARDEICRLTEGNPFFVEEVLKTMIAEVGFSSERLTRESAPSLNFQIPRRVKDAVLRPTELLSPEAIQVLRYAAVSGRQFDFRLLEEVIPMNEAQLLPVMKELLGAQLVVEVTSDQFAFRHALTREAVYSTLLLRERKQFHHMIGDAIERVHAAELSGQVGELAYHYYEAGAWEKALKYSQSAGETAQAQYAPREAIEHFTRALEAAGHLAMPLPTAILRARGQAYETVGEFDRARADHEQAFEVATKANDGRFEWQALIDLGFLWASTDYRKAGEYFKEALARARLLGDPDLIAHTLNRLGNWMDNTGEVEAGLESHREALDIFQSREDRQGMAETLDLLGMANNLAGDIPGAAYEMERAIDLFRELGDARGLVSALSMRASLTSMTETSFSAHGDPNELENSIREALQVARQIGWAAGQAFVEFTSGSTFAMFGEFGKALAHAKEGVRIAKEIEHLQWTCGSFTHLGQVYVQMLRPALAKEALQAGRPLAFETGSAWWIGYNTSYLALANLLDGDVSHAESLLKEIVPSDHVPRDETERRMAWAWGETMLAKGDAGEAMRIAELLIASVPSPRVPVRPTDWRSEPIPALLRLKGQALSAQTRYEEAERSFEDAVRGAKERRLLPLLSQILIDLGGLFDRLKRWEDAGREYAEAGKTIQAIASTIEDEALRADYFRAASAKLAKSRPISTRRLAKKEFGGLTERERQVAVLVAGGKSNPEIAAELIVSERTVTTHVSNILSKLGFNSRTQIAAWAVEKGLFKQNT